MRIPMDCLAALTTLEAARPDSDDLAQPEFSSAVAHLAGCPHCQATFAAQQEFDREFGRLCREVAPPQELLPRILAQLQSVPASAKSSHDLSADLPDTAANDSNRVELAVSTVDQPTVSSPTGASPIGAPPTGAPRVQRSDLLRSKPARLTVRRMVPR